MPLISSLAGHLWTVAPRLRPPPPDPPSRQWSATVDDPHLGVVRLTGKLSGEPDAADALLLVHGITGCADSRYARVGAAAALARGMACLRFNLRGADRRGEDFYHAGLASDLAAALESPELAGHRRLHVLGYSLGGHLALKLAASRPVDRLAAVAAVCAPLDLAACQGEFDRPSRAVYRRYVLRGLQEIYSRVAERRPVPLPVVEARRIRTIREWDERVVAPRHGFAGADDYYRRAGVGDELGGLRVPSLLVASRRDPMVPPVTVERALERVSAPRLAVRWSAAGGHLGFPSPVRLAGDDEEDHDDPVGAGDDGGRRGREVAGAEPASPGSPGDTTATGDLESQVLAWLRSA